MGAANASIEVRRSLGSLDASWLAEVIASVLAHSVLAHSVFALGSDSGLVTPSKVRDCLLCEWANGWQPSAGSRCQPLA